MKPVARDGREHDCGRKQPLASTTSPAISGIGGYGLSVLKIIGVDIVLAGDNAVVIALACRTLPPRQRTVGIILGTAAAVVMRIVFTLAVGSLLGVPILALAGGLILFWIAVKLLLAEEASEESVRSGETCGMR